MKGWFDLREDDARRRGANEWQGYSRWGGSLSKLDSRFRHPPMRIVRLVPAIFVVLLLQTLPVIDAYRKIILHHSALHGRWPHKTSNRNRFARNRIGPRFAMLSAGSTQPQQEAQGPSCFAALWCDYQSCDAMNFSLQTHTARPHTQMCEDPSKLSDSDNDAPSHTHTSAVASPRREARGNICSI